MDTEDAIVLLATAPASAYREYLYRPDGELARWISDWYEVVARPGQPIGQPPQEGDVLLEVTLGHLSAGRCAVVTAGDLWLMALRRRLANGQLLLRLRRRVGTSEPLSVEPNVNRTAESTVADGEMSPSSHDCPKRPADEVARSRSPEGILGIDFTFIESDKIKSITIQDFAVGSATLPPA